MKRLKNFSVLLPGLFGVSLALGQTVTISLSGTYASNTPNTPPYVAAGANWTLSMVVNNPPTLLPSSPGQVNTNYVSASYTLNGAAIPLTSNYALTFNPASISAPMVFVFDNSPSATLPATLIANNQVQFFSSYGANPSFVPGNYTVNYAVGIAGNYYLAGPASGSVLTISGGSGGTPLPTTPLPPSGWMAVLGVAGLSLWELARRRGYKLL